MINTKMASRWQLSPFKTNKQKPKVWYSRQFTSSFICVIKGHFEKLSVNHRSDPKFTIKGLSFLFEQAFLISPNHNVCTEVWRKIIFSKIEFMKSKVKKWESDWRNCASKRLVALLIVQMFVYKFFFSAKTEGSVPSCYSSAFQCFSLVYGKINSG